jgi:hypothetical protein
MIERDAPFGGNVLALAQALADGRLAASYDVTDGRLVSENFDAAP